MAFYRRWLLLGLSSLAVTGCPAEERPRPAAATAQATPTAGPPAIDDAAGAALLAAQIRSDRATLLDGVKLSAERKALMKALSQEIGVECDHCHDVADFHAPTPNKTIANYMFKHFSQAMACRGGSEVVECAAAERPACRSCHKGQVKFLGDRSGEANRKRINALMGKIDKALQKRDGGDVDCETCHGEDNSGKPFLPRA
jgi:hypothetical protein